MKPAMSTIILGAAKDPAGAEVLAPVLTALQASGQARCQALVQAQAGAVMRRHGIAVIEAPAGTVREQAAWADQVLERVGADMVLIGTSKGPSIGNALILAARQRNVPSLTILDTWFNFASRFSGETPEDRLAFLPDAIAVIDEACRRTMLAEGFPPELLHITGPGTPYLDSLARYAAAPGPALRAREGLGIGRDEALLLFASQPLSADYAPAPGHPDWLGYTEKTAFAGLLQALSLLGNPANLRILLKLHPREAAGGFDALAASSGVPVLPGQDLGPREAVAACDIVVGMTTILLVEAVLMGKPTLSYQPGRLGEDPLAFVTGSGACPRLDDPESLAGALEDILAPGGPPPGLGRARERFVVDGRATERIVALARRLLRQGTNGHKTAGHIA